MRLDYGKMSEKHRRLHLENSLKLYGLDVVVTRPQNYLNTYEEVYPEPEVIYPEEKDPDEPATNYDPQGEPRRFQGRILIDTPMQGLLMNQDVLSLSDKVDTQYTITTNLDLELEDRLKVTFPDGIEIDLRVVERLTHHPFTKTVHKFMTVVV